MIKNSEVITDLILRLTREKLILRKNRISLIKKIRFDRKILYNLSKDINKIDNDIDNQIIKVK